VTNTPGGALKTGAKVGIGVGSFAALCVLLGILFFILRYRRNNKQKSKPVRSLDGLSELRGNPISELGPEGEKIRAEFEAGTKAKTGEVNAVAVNENRLAELQEVTGPPRELD
jgi:hypothetical protein